MITLRTTVGDDPKMSMRYEWFRDLNGLSHDAAVAHALVQALQIESDGGNGSIVDNIICNAECALRTNFGIE